MKKQERNENGNKGFSLVELIVVVAIMAVLLVVLTPQYLRYVERTRLQKDNSAISEIANTIKIALSDENVNSATATGTVIETTAASSVAGTAKEFDFSTTTTANAAVCAELVLTIKDKVATTSNTYRDSDAAIKFTITNNNGVVTIATEGWIESVGGTATTSTDPKIF